MLHRRATPCWASAFCPKATQWRCTVAGRTQQLKGKTNEAVGKAKAAAGYQSGRGKTEAKGETQNLKGKAQQAMGKARTTVKKKTR